ncbi:MAG: 4-hydroxy-3-methylbut-2-enyl diphosphate reductase [Muribaculaceae bacterium]|nr:4-hydroxy-3-methylbut-2-enyl diphosphate reductase [Muribaculaceae bacterium]
MQITVSIDDNSGFCFGVTSAISKAEEELRKGDTLYCLGDIVHNGEEVSRLHALGLQTITHKELSLLKNARVLLRAHGEPPTTYRMAHENNIEIIDATCPVVLQLQRRIKASYDADSTDVQIVIYGKKGHAEVNGLVGQTDGNAIVLEDVSEINRLDFSKPIDLYSQTTKSLEGFNIMKREIERRMFPDVRFRSYDTICRRVANRVEGIRNFASSQQLILFVSGAKSSNGKILFTECKAVNPATYLVSNCDDVRPEWLDGVTTVGICGATSTPRWLMEKVKERVIELSNQ